MVLYSSLNIYRARLTMYNYRMVVRTLVRIGSTVPLEFDVATIEIAVGPKGGYSYYLRPDLNRN